MNFNQAQLQAINSESKRLLVLAGAGAGKTKTLIQKIEYLVKEKGIQADKILAITFTRNAANEMVDRLICINDPSGTYEHEINNKALNADKKRFLRNQNKNKINWLGKLTMTTFHGLCYRMMRNEGVKGYDNQFTLLLNEFDIKDQMDEEQITPENPIGVLRRALINVAGSDQETLLKIKWYLVSYFAKREKRHTLQKPTYQDEYFYTSLNGTNVRSKSEIFIADWLYRHDIAFEYERRVVGDKRNFYPDFYIPAADIFIEHVSDQSQGVPQKREQLLIKKHGIAQTNEAETYDATGFSKALDAILAKRLGHLTKNLIKLSIHEVLNPYEKELEAFLQQMKRVIDLMKVDSQKPEEVFERGLADPHDRVKDFYFILERVWKEFHDYCKQKSLLDFNDLLIQAVSLLKNNSDVLEHFKGKYDYILVDEFQDVNDLQVELLKLLLKENTQLFCVGDDWQSIYSFRGAVVDYIIDFQKHYPESESIVLNYNYRSTNTIVEAGNEVIKHNKFKIDKSIIAFNQEASVINLYVANKEYEDGLEFAMRRISELNAAGLGAEDILLLGRRTAMLLPYRKMAFERGVKATFRTIHSSKGLEAHTVFIVGLKEGSGGFPDLWMQDRIFQVIRSQQLNLMMEEERRLFYVAITRARNELNLITEAGCESSFLKEIPDPYLKRITILHSGISDTLSCTNCNKLLLQKTPFCPFCGVKLES